MFTRLHPFWRLCKIIHFIAISASRSYLYFLAPGTLFPSLKPEKLYLWLLCSHIFLWLWTQKSWKRFSSLNDSWETIYWLHLENPGLSSHLKVLNIVISAKCLLLCKITYRFQELGHGCLWGGSLFNLLQ